MRRISRAALTLVEMLVAMAVTLIMMGAVVTLFGTVGNSVTGSRAVMEISERLRNCRNRLQTDLGGITVAMLPPCRPETNAGYLEAIEGPDTDGTYMLPYPPPNPIPQGYGLLSDTDDLLMFTTRSRAEPFIGQSTLGSVESLTAEVVWFAIPNGQTIMASNGTTFPLRTLYRRVLLVAPSWSGATNLSIANFQQSNDISACAPSASATNSVLNTLGDLTKRECRFGHAVTSFPFPVTLPPPILTGPRLGDDVILTNVLAFDVKVYDPNAPIRLSADGLTALVPSDPGYATRSDSNPPTARGAYVDLNFNRYLSTNTTTSYFDPNSSAAYFSKNVQLKSQLPFPTYDTGSLHYEQNGVDEDGDSAVDEGLNGLDDDNNGIVDDANELETSPPYPVPLRGIQIKIRVYEPDSRQVREVTVVQDFMPQ